MTDNDRKKIIDEIRIIVMSWPGSQKEWSPKLDIARRLRQLAINLADTYSDFDLGEAISTEALGRRIERLNTRVLDLEERVSNQENTENVEVDQTSQERLDFHQVRLNEQTDSIARLSNRVRTVENRIESVTRKQNALHGALRVLTESDRD